MTIDADSRLKGWVEEYGVPGTVSFEGYTELGGSDSSGWTMGRCTSTAVWKDGECASAESLIYLDAGMATAPDFFARCVLWHEFCHANAFNEDGTGNSHDSHFKSYVRRKPLYWIGDEIAQVIGFVWVRRRRPWPSARTGPC